MSDPWISISARNVVGNDLMVYFEDITAGYPRSSGALLSIALDADDDAIVAMLRGLGFCPPAPPPPPPPAPPEVPVIVITEQAMWMRVVFSATTSTHGENYERFLNIPADSDPLQVTAAILLNLAS
jgi:hypothetical protein